MAADKLVLQNMVFYGYHGVFAAEKELGQRFEVDVELYLDLHQAGLNDDLEATVNYAEVYTFIKKLVEERAFNLVEGLAEEIAATLLAAYNLQEIVVRVRKPQPPVGGLMDYFAVEIRRRAPKVNQL
ncbi:MAG TPA: dihydroneopterin aldolase [Firmicutes bacterium]|uniref:7,8-dihydroneopterin aldolase n=1 Tax=Capillibacterium thermochitinicola TaxID=2699427 RepID=A0A8J6I0S8_9FIRM|nr:dihydroneopterin aldolase [Capillibacterium thermochitinicola]MBA2133168.1 dihydroneopterin aldolase [Capillibacterium thermochitinicola]HHW11711.1 dihydroneopterin aldolase [Bacillota bacterium]